jgi:hypothetical protein
MNHKQLILPLATASLLFVIARPAMAASNVPSHISLWPSSPVLALGQSLMVFGGGCVWLAFKQVNPPVPMLIRAGSFLFVVGIFIGLFYGPK